MRRRFAICFALALAPGCGLISSDDCDGGKMVAMYPDLDGDRFGDSGAEPVLVCDKSPTPAGLVANAKDCDDNDSRVHPGQMEFFSTPIAGRTMLAFDFDCDGVETPSVSSLGPNGEECTFLGAGQCVGGQPGGGWWGTVPACGDTAEWSQCGGYAQGQPGYAYCPPQISMNTQACH